MDLSAGGMLSLSDSEPAGPDGLYVTGGPVGQIGTLSPSASESAILVDPGRTLPSTGLTEMLLPAIPVGPVGLINLYGTLSPSDSDPAGLDGLYVTGGPDADEDTILICRGVAWAVGPCGNVTSG